MTDFQSEKQLVRKYFEAVDSGAPMDGLVAPDFVWRGFHPFNEMTGLDAVMSAFWQPLHQSLTSLQRRMDIFIAGSNLIESHGGRWVVSMGHLMGLFDAPWLGIQPTGKIVMLRYADFHRVEDGVITETAMYFDLSLIHI